MTEVIKESEAMLAFKSGVDDLLAKRSYFISQVLPKLVEGQDYHIINGRKSLAKGGAELLCSMYNLTAQFVQDMDTIKAFEGSVKGLVALECNLYDKNNQCVAEARGASTLDKCDGDPNKCVKMAEKSAYISATIRATGLSDVFTQDLEDMPVSAIKNGSKPEDRVEIIDSEPDLEGRDRQVSYQDFSEMKHATEKQKSFLKTLIEDKCDTTAKDEYLGQLNSPYLSRYQCSELISTLLTA